MLAMLSLPSIEVDCFVLDLVPICVQLMVEYGVNDTHVPRNEDTLLLLSGY